jgi:hypothetical protein
MAHKVIKCEFLDIGGIWSSATLIKNDFKFVRNYDSTNENTIVQIWEGRNKDLFILKNVEIYEVK